MGENDELFGVILSARTLLEVRRRSCEITVVALT